MRKLFSLLFVFLLVFPVTACGQSKGEESGTVVDAEIIPVTDAAESAQIGRASCRERVSA